MARDVKSRNTNYELLVVQSVPLLYLPKQRRCCSLPRISRLDSCKGMTSTTASCLLAASAFSDIDQELRVCGAWSFQSIPKIDMILLESSRRSALNSFNG